MSWKREDTIAAIATPPGVGAIGIIRVSGPEALAVVEPIFAPAEGGSLARAESHRAVYGWIVEGDRMLDEVLVLPMRAPRTYTAEDVVEIHCHGGPLVVREVLALACRHGARLAERGEFTMRAFLNGRLDLTRAEAVADVINARSRGGLAVSVAQLRGRLYEAIAANQEAVARVAALVAAGIDFPEEGIVFAHREEIAERLDSSREGLAAMVAGAGRGRLLREGVGVALIGRPNVGKSSLLNALLRENRAIVTEVPGTTRDTLEEGVELDGLLVRLVDTAGIRASADRVEGEGIARSRDAADAADLVLLVLDGAAPLAEEDRALLAEAREEATVVVVNKMDLLGDAPPAWLEELGLLPAVAVSALTGAGIDDLEARVREWALAGERPLPEDGLITNLRQEQAARRALEALGAAAEGLQAGVGEELVAIDLRTALDALGEIVGETTADDLLERIFAEFCIGK